MSPSSSPSNLESTALTAAGIAAAVVAGLSLSLVPNVELVTLVVFSTGVLLGPRRGTLVGAAGMVLYVLANSALRGFPPSPLPVLSTIRASIKPCAEIGHLPRAHVSRPCIERLSVPEGCAELEVLEHSLRLSLFKEFLGEGHVRAE